MTVTITVTVRDTLTGDETTETATFTVDQGQASRVPGGMTPGL